MKASIRNSRLTLGALVIACVSLSVVASHAQSQFVKGFEGSFGIRSASVGLPNSLPERTQLSGGRIGMVLGNDAVRLNVGIFGYYEATRGVTGTTSLYESSLKVSVYPLSEKDCFVQPYFTTGLSYDRFHFGGYLEGEPGTINYSRTTLPHLGKVKEVNTLAGVGLEFNVLNDDNFVRFFTEVNVGHNVSSNGTGAFSGAQSGRSIVATMGVRFGARN